MKETKLGVMFAEPNHLPKGVKDKMKIALRENRQKYKMHDMQTHCDDPAQVEVILKCDKMWWHPMSSQRNKEYLEKRKKQRAGGIQSPVTSPKKDGSMEDVHSSSSITVDISPMKSYAPLGKRSRSMMPCELHETSEKKKKHSPTEARQSKSTWKGGMQPGTLKKLQKALKDQGVNTKGTKAELEKRLEQSKSLEVVAKRSVWQYALKERVEVLFYAGTVNEEWFQTVVEDRRSREGVRKYKVTWPETDEISWHNSCEVRSVK